MKRERFSKKQLVAAAESQINPLNLEIGESAEAYVVNRSSRVQTVIYTRTK